MKTPARRPIVLLTDFGDGCFQGVMKGVILARAPGATIVDLDHHVAPGAVVHAACVLEAAVDHFPPDSVFCCVVDPGVGTARRRIVVECPGGPSGVGPDNGVLTPLLARRGAVAREIRNGAWFADDDTKTFEGRSRFAPAAAALASGGRARDAGPVVADPVRVPLAAARRTRDGLAGSVVYVDPFGNLVTSIDEALMAALGARDGLRVSVGGRRAIPVGETYASVAPRRPVAYVGSGGRLEVAIRGGHAASALRAAAGDAVVVRRARRRP